MVLYPWPQILRRTGFCFTYKPREVWWQQGIKQLKLKPSQKVLDVGCGEGIILDRLVADYKIKGFGVDIDQEAIGEAKKKSVFKLDLRVADACSLPFSDGFFDVVISFDTMEHIRKQAKAVSEMVRVLKKGGKMLIYTINKNQSLTWNWLLDKLGFDIYQRVDHHPELFIDPQKLKLKLKQKGVEVKKLTLFDSFFTLACDEVIMFFILILAKVGLNKKRYHCLGRFILFSLTGFSKIATPLLNFLDIPWRRGGFSNSFLLVGEKQ